MSDLSGRTTIVVGASRGLGHGIATALAEAGAPVQAYAARAGQTEDEYVQQMGPRLSPEAAGAALVELVGADGATAAPAYLLTGAGPQILTDPE